MPEQEQQHREYREKDDVRQALEEGDPTPQGPVPGKVENRSGDKAASDENGRDVQPDWESGRQDAVK